MVFGVPWGMRKCFTLNAHKSLPISTVQSEKQMHCNTYTYVNTPDKPFTFVLIFGQHATDKSILAGSHETVTWMTLSSDAVYRLALSRIEFCCMCSCVSFDFLCQFLCNNFPTLSPRLFPQQSPSRFPPVGLCTCILQDVRLTLSWHCWLVNNVGNQ